MQQVQFFGASPSPSQARKAPPPIPQVYPGASSSLAPVLQSIAALSRADQAELLRAFRAADKAAKPKRIGGGNTFQGFDDFQPAFMGARLRAIEAFGPQWYLNPDLALYAQIPGGWANCKIFSGTKRGPRDVHFPRAQFWPGGTLPVGPVYADYYAIDPSGDIRITGPAREAERAAARAKWEAMVADGMPDFTLEHTPEDIDGDMEAV